MVFFMTRLSVGHTIICPILESIRLKLEGYKCVALITLFNQSSDTSAASTATVFPLLS